MPAAPIPVGLRPATQVGHLLVGKVHTVRHVEVRFAPLQRGPGVVEVARQAIDAPPERARLHRLANILLPIISHDSIGLNHIRNILRYLHGTYMNTPANRNSTIR